MKAAPELCVACKAFQAECLAPVDDGALPMCWLCAHHVVDHEVALKDAVAATCECAPDQVYPLRVLQQQSAMGILRVSRANDLQGRYKKTARALTDEDLLDRQVRKSISFGERFGVSARRGRC